MFLNRMIKIETKLKREEKVMYDYESNQQDATI